MHELTQKITAELDMLYGLYQMAVDLTKRIRPEDEEKIWREFLDILATIERPVLIHYGSYETTFIKTMCDRYGTPMETSEVLKTSEVLPLPPAINLLSVIYGHVYFPVASN